MITLPRRHRRPRRTYALAFAVLVGTMLSGLLPVVPTAATQPAPGAVRIRVLSNRADLVSGGDALVRIFLPAGTSWRELRVTANGRDITRQFSPHGRRHAVTGLVRGLRVGSNVLGATLADGPGARLTVTNHPSRGPVFAGPQVQPWTCTTQENGLGTPLNDGCEVPPKISWLYQPEGAEEGDYRDYDPSNPPDDVATTTTDRGAVVPYVIRVEEGTIDRSIYKVMVLADPRSPWTALRPQRTWNRKLFVAFGGGCGTPHLQTPPTSTTSYPFGPLEVAFGNPAANGQIEQPAVLSRGWMAAATGMNTLNQNCNEVVSAEALMMLKEHLVERYGPIRRTVSTGGSGGSIQQYNLASAYPGLLDGIVPTQSFPDLWSLVGDATDCYLLHRYFTAVSPALWPDVRDQLAVTGKTGPLACGEFLATLVDWMDPQNRGPLQAGAAVRFGCFLPPTETYRPVLNPTGARCSVQDYQGAIWGRRGPLNAAPLPWDNTGVQYGLRALERGDITPAQFIDLNEKVGGIDNEGNFTAGRTRMDATTARTMYRAGRTTDARGLRDVPILDIRGAVESSDPEATSDLHQPFYTDVMRARLRAANGTDATMVTWSVIPENMDMAGVLAMDRWLEAIADDDRDLPYREKIIRNKPRNLVDTCWIDGVRVTDEARCAERYPGPANGGDARIAAGGPRTGDVRRCHLKPLDRDDYRVSFSATEWARLQQVFPDGVCDWARRSVGYQPMIPWMSFAAGPGGEPLGSPPSSVPTR